MIRTVAPTGTASSGVTGKAGAQHRVNLAEVTSQRLLIDDFEHVDQPVGRKRDQAIVVIAFQEHITHKERNNRLNFPPLGRVTFFMTWGR